MSEQQNWLDLDHVVARLCLITAEQLGLGIDEVTPNSRIVEDLNCDSLDMIELIMETEDEFGITIPDTPETPVGKLIFTRTPFRMRDLAEFAFLNQGTGSPDRSGWRKRKVAMPQRPERAFSQLGGKWSGDLGVNRKRLDPLDSDHPYRMFRRAIDGMVSVEIPATEVVVGSDDPTANDDEKPRHSVSLSSYLIDIEPVSVIAFCRFLNSIDARPQELDALVGLPANDDRVEQMQFRHHDDRWLANSSVGMQPVVMLSWFAANAYSLWANGCDWRDYKSDDGFLPTESQWECAAQGALDHNQSVHAAQHQRGTKYADGVMPIPDVHQPLAVSKFGLRHMGGTVWHWCRDWFDPSFYNTPASRMSNPIHRDQTGVRSERGGSWVGPIDLCRPSYRRGRNPDARGRCLGFRCVSIEREKSA